MQTVFQNLTWRKIFNSKSDALYFFQSKIWRVAKILNHNLTLSVFSNSKSDTLWKFLFKICFSNHLFRLSLSYYQRTTCWILTMSCGKKIFLRVCGMCLSHVWYYLFGYCLLYGTWVLGGCDDEIICTTRWFIQISLDFRKWLVHKDFILRDIKILVYLPWPSRTQSTIFISSDSNLVFLTCSFLSAKTDPPLVCVILVFW